MYIDAFSAMEASRGCTSKHEFIHLIHKAFVWISTRKSVKFQLTTWMRTSIANRTLQYILPIEAEGEDLLKWILHDPSKSRLPSKGSIEIAPSGSVSTKNLLCASCKHKLKVNVKCRTEYRSHTAFWHLVAAKVAMNSITLSSSRPCVSQRVGQHLWEMTSFR